MNYPPLPAPQEVKKRPIFKPRRPQAQPQSYITGPLQTPSVGAPPDEKSWLRQQADDLMAVVTGIPNLMWHTAKAYGELDFGAVIDGLSKDPKVMLDATRETMGAMLHGMTEHWRGPKGDFTPVSVLSAPIRRPILAGLDLLTALSLGTTAGIKMAPMAGKIASATRGADAAQFAAKWAGAFKSAQGFPLALTKKALRGAGRLPIIKPTLEAAGWDEFGLKANSAYQTAKLQYTGRSHEQLKELVEHQFGKGLYDEVIDIEAGLKALNPAEHPPEVVERMRDLAKTVKQIKEDGFRAEVRLASGEWTPQAAEQAKLNHLRERMRMKGVPDEELTDAAVQARLDQTYAEADVLGTGDIQRDLFWHAMADNSTSFDDFMYGLMEPVGSQTLRKAGVLERFTGKSKAYQKNPNIRHENYVRGHNNMLGTVAGVRSILNDPDLARTVRRDAIPQGWHEVPRPLIKNLDYQQEALSILFRDVAEAELKHGVGSPESIAAALVKSDEKIGDLAKRMGNDILEGVNDDLVIAVPKGVARFLNLELAPTGPFGRIYDKGMNFWRDAVLTFMPRYYVNNLLGNSILMLLGGYKPWSAVTRQHEGVLGREMRSANFFVEEGGLMEKIGASSGMVKLRNALSNIQYMTENKPRALMALQKVGENVRDIKLSDNLIKMVGVEGSTQPQLEQITELALKLRNLDVELRGSMGAAARVGELPAFEAKGSIPPEVRMAAEQEYMASRVHRMGAAVESAIEGQKGYLTTRQQIAQLVEPVEDAYRWVETFLGPYGKITPLARKAIRRVIPFWTFGSTMARLMMLMPLVRPKTTFLFSQMAQMAQDAWDDERLPEYLKGTMWVGTGKNGMSYFARMSGFNPFEAMSERKLGGMPIPALLDPTQGPLIGTAIKLVGGYDQFSHRPPPLEPDQMIDNAGRVWEIGQGGVPKRVSPQTPFLDALGELIPQISVLNDVMAWSGFQVPGSGPKLYQMPDGTKFNPRHWQWGLANGLMRSFGASVMPVDLAKVKAQSRAQSVRMIRHLGKQALRAADEDERAQFMKLAKDAIENLRGR